MDTDQLTQMAYKCLRLADEASDCLKSELGAACSQFRTEDEYLRAALEYVTAIEADPVSYLDSWNLLEHTDRPLFKRKLQVLRKHLEATIATARDLRGPTEW